MMKIEHFTSDELLLIANALNTAWHLPKRREPETPSLFGPDAESVFELHDRISAAMPGPASVELSPKDHRIVRTALRAIVDGRVMPRSEFSILLGVEPEVVDAFVSRVDA